MSESLSRSPRASTRRVRKSIAHLPELTNKENHTISGIETSVTTKVIRKTRSKSIGPGGLDVLNETTGNSQKIISNIRSILKPTIPISPIRVIPPRNQNQRASRSSPRRNQGAGNNDTINDDRKSDQEAQEARQREAEEIQQRREARRKSLANRRVSFAPEATLHTWDIVELPEDATTSSEATNSTRRASSGTTLQSGTITANQSAFDTAYHDVVSSTPAGQQDVIFEQRSKNQEFDGGSAVTEDLEAFSSPGDSIASEAVQFSDDDAESYGSDDDSDGDKDSIVGSNLTNRVDAEDDGEDSVRSESPDNTCNIGQPIPIDPSLSQVLDQDLSMADGGDATMDLIEDDTMLMPSAPLSAINAIRTRSQENVNPFSPAFGARLGDAAKEDNSEMSMDMTMMIGGIMGSDNSSPKKTKRRSIAPNTRRSMARRRSAVDATAVLADETMDLVTVYGGIQSSSQEKNYTLYSEEQEISMDMTRAIGGIALPTAQALIDSTNVLEEISMDFTQALGQLLPAAQSTQISTPTRSAETSKKSKFGVQESLVNGQLLSPLTEHTEPSEHGTINMDMTKAVGYIFEDASTNEQDLNAIQAVDSILPPDLKTDNKLLAKQLMEEEADHGQLTRSPFAKGKGQGDAQTDSETTTKTAVNSPGQLPSYLSATRATSAKQSTPKKMPSTPSKQLTPNPNRPTTPSKTPPNPNISMRKTSPKRLFKSSISKSPKLATPSLQSSKTVLGTHEIPLVVLTPGSRRASGIGIDQIGMGSPMVAAKLDRRASIGDSTQKFIPIGGKAIRFEDPRTIELELEKESGVLTFPESISDSFGNDSGKGLSQDSTTSLKDVIATLSPKKNKFKGRKSLAPSARGILGKRPIELDEDEDEDATPKRLKGIQSPVKSIRLPGHLEDATLRLASVPQLALPGTTSISNNEDPNSLVTLEQLRKTFSSQQPDEDAQMSLQDFLNLTNIQFIDLTTTKRRHTGAKIDNIGIDGTSSTETSLINCVVAGVCTIPMLDLFQHSCRELKKYISEGRSVVREIEKDTLEDNPALFHEYISAPPDIREIMDNQFKNIKVHARYESKASWYEWRSKLFDGLKSGLIGIHEGLIQDDKILGKQEKKLLDQVTPMAEKYATLQKNAELLQSEADTFADCDHDTLRDARERLSQQEHSINQKKELLAQLQAELHEKEQDVIEIQERRIETMAEIKEANRVADENRGWAFGEVKSLKDAVNALEDRTGWKMPTCDAANPTFAYQDTLFLSVYPDFSAALPQLKSQESVSLLYESKDGAVPAMEPPIIHRFMLQNLKARLSVLPYTSPPPSLGSVLKFVSTGWDLAQEIVAETARVRTQFQTTERILDDSTLLVQSMVLLRAPEETEIQSKLFVQFTVKTLGESTQVSSKVDLKIKTIYGKDFKGEAMTKFIKSRIKNSKGQIHVGGWKEALVDLKAALLKGKISLI